MKNRIFDKGLYIEGLRQLSGVGLPTVLVLMLLSLIEPISAARGGVAFSFGASDAANAVFWGQFPENTVRSLPQLDVVAFLGTLVLPAVFVLWLFRFLSQRRACDVYDAMPHARLTLYISYYAAAMTWTLAAILLPAAVALGGMALVLDIHFLWSWIADSLFTSIAVALLIGGGTVLARSLSGTSFAAIALALLVLFLPRVVIDTWLDVLYTQLPMIRGCGAIDFGVLRLNSLVNGILFGLNTELTGLTSAPSTTAEILYTTVLGLVYAVLGGRAFCARRSEFAGNVTSGKMLHMLYGAGLSMLVCVPACVRILFGVKDERDGFVVAILYALAILIFVLYMLLTTRQWKGVLRSLPALLLVVVLNGVFLGGVILCRDHVLSFSPSTEEVTAVRVVDTQYLGLVYDRNGPSDSENCYIEKNASNIILSDETARKLVTSKLASMVTRAQNGEPSGGGTPIRVEMEVDGKWTTRTLQVDVSMNALLRTCYFEHEEYQRLVTELPPLNQENVTLVKVGDITDKSVQRSIYDLLMEETENVDVKHWMEHLANHPSASDNAPYEKPEVVVQITKGDTVYELKFIIPSFFEKTFSAYLNATQENMQGEALRMLNGQSSKKWTRAYIRLYNFPGHEGFDCSSSLKATDTELSQAIAATLSTDAIDVSQPTVTILFFSGEEGETYLYTTTFMADEDALLDVLPPLPWSTPYL